jgi:hypothetical protein
VIVVSIGVAVDEELDILDVVIVDEDAWGVEMLVIVAKLLVEDEGHASPQRLFFFRGGLVDESSSIS